jgi:protoporphyrinogen oxidase
LKIGLIGGGMMGLASAFYLSEAGAEVTILEKADEIGGLSRSEEIVPGLHWDRYYHVILSTDRDLLRFIDEIGLSLDVQFVETKTGFFTDGQLHSMSSSLEFLRFKPLSMWDKMRLGAGILYSAKLANPSKLEKIYARNWLIRVFGRRNYEKLWDPLLRSKLGNAKTQASGSFIWACINRYYGTREKSSKKEMMGVVKGGYHSISMNIRKKLEAKGVTILTDCEAKVIEPLEGGRIKVHCGGGRSYDFDRVVATIPNPEIDRLGSYIAADFRQRLKKVSYLSLVCATIVLKKPLSPFYVTNLTDPGFPFTGFIEATPIVPKEILGDRGLIYLPRYFSPDDSDVDGSDDRILKEFFGGIMRLFPQFTEKDILGLKLHREQYVQPILTVNYSEVLPSMKTPLENFYIVNTSMIANSTLNNNQVVQLAQKMAVLLTNEDHPLS